MNEEILLNTVIKLIKIPSVADNQTALRKSLEVIEGMLQEQEGITIEHFEQNGKPSLLAYNTEKRPEKFRVMLNGHVDVVGANEAQFIPEIKNGKLYGRGALDMKTAAVTMTEVFSRLASEVSYPLGLQIVTDEEIGGHNGTLHQIEQGVDADFVITGEFTPLSTICTELRGICWARVQFAGEAAHSAYLWRGNNALLLAQNYINELLKIYPVPENEVWATTVNVANVATDNDALNRVPSNATVELDIRYIAEDERFTSNENVKQFLSGLLPGASVEIIHLEPSLKTPENNADVQALAKSLADRTGKTTEFIKKHGGADIRFYSNRGRAAVAYGLQGDGLHGKDEFVEVNSITRYREVLEDFLRTLS